MWGLPPAAAADLLLRRRLLVRCLTLPVQRIRPHARQPGVRRRCDSSRCRPIPPDTAQYRCGLRRARESKSSLIQCLIAPNTALADLQRRRSRWPAALRSRVARFSGPDQRHLCGIGGFRVTSLTLDGTGGACACRAVVSRPLASERTPFETFWRTHNLRSLDGMASFLINAPESESSWIPTIRSSRRTHRRG